MKKILCFLKNKYAIAVLAAILLSVVMELAILVSLPAKYGLGFASEANEFSSELTISPVGYEVNGTNYSPLDQDPQMYLSGFSSDLYAVKIEFNKQLKENTPVQIYYPDESGALSEQNSVKQIIQAGMQSIIIELPPEHYDFLRVDINGEFSLKNITYTDQPVVKEKVPEHIYWKRLAAISVVFILAAVFVASQNSRQTMQKKIWKVKHCIRQFVSLTNILFIGWLLVVSLALERVLFGMVLAKGFNFSQYCLVFTIILIPSFLYRFREELGQRIEIGFLVIGMSVGILLISIIPSGPLISWDDGIHLGHTIEVAGLGVKRMTEADDMVIARTFGLDYTPEVIEQQNDILEQAFQEGTVRETVNNIGYRRLGHFPAAFGIFLGRLLHFPYHIIFKMGKFFNLFSYVLLAFFAIKKLKTGKVILSIFALFPTNLFLAVNYSYDPWVTGWFLFGFSNFISEFQETHKLLNWRSMLGLILPFVIGCGPKAVYIPFMLILLLMPKEKFSTKKQANWFRFCVICATVLVLLSFLAPFLFKIGSGEFVGDLRGSSDVDAGAQLSFILHHPIEYAGILLKFLLNEYLTLGASSGYMTFFAYLGGTGNHILLVVALAVAVFTDKNEYDLRTTTFLFRGCISLAFLVTVCAIVSALYVNFTPVGHSTVAGCQLRYLLPILFPVFYVLGSPHIQNRINKSLYNTVLLFIPAYISVKGFLSLVYGETHYMMVAIMLFLCLLLPFGDFMAKRVFSKR